MPKKLRIKIKRVLMKRSQQYYVHNHITSSWKNLISQRIQKILTMVHESILGKTKWEKYFIVLVQNLKLKIMFLKVKISIIFQIFLFIEFKLISSNMSFCQVSERSFITKGKLKLNFFKLALKSVFKPLHKWLSEQVGKLIKLEQVNKTFDFFHLKSIKIKLKIFLSTAVELATKSLNCLEVTSSYLSVNLRYN